jgi:hypothetical protein
VICELEAFMSDYVALIQLHLKADDAGTLLDKPWVGNRRPVHNDELTVEFNGRPARGRVLNTYVPLRASGEVKNTTVLPIISLLKI